MIDLYSWPTPNGHKVHIMLEECGLPYAVHAINIGKGDQFQPDFLRISPNNRMPAIVDRDGPGGKPLSIFESGAILIYLANKTGKFLPKDAARRTDVIQWLMFQMGGVGPMLGQAHHFLEYAKEKMPYPMERYRNESNRLYGVVDRRLHNRDWVAADEYSIADMAIFPWFRNPHREGVDIKDYRNVWRWMHRMYARPGVQRGVKVLADRQSRPGPQTEQAREIMFGATQYKRRAPLPAAAE